jgi:hypothetical protein
MTEGFFMKYFFTLLIIGVLCSVIIFINPQSAYSSSAGAPIGRTGSNGESTCIDVGCHTGNTFNTTGTITTNIPASGYKAGQTYNINVKITEAGSSSFGFQVKASEGLFVETGETQLLGSGSYITHKSTSIGGTDSRQWNFQWVAPASNAQTVTFSAAILTNSNTTGYKVYLDELTVQKASSNSISNLNKKNITIYPVPFDKSFTVKNIQFVAEKVYASVYTLEGKKMAGKETTSNLVSFNTQNFAKGIYILKLQAGETIVTKKIAKM